MRKASIKQKKISKTFSITIDVWDAVFSNIPEGKRSQYVEKAIIGQLKRDAYL